MGEAPRPQKLTEDSTSLSLSLPPKPHHKSISYLVTKGTSTESSREMPMSTLPRE